jgi:hypothetical protein
LRLRVHPLLSFASSPESVAASNLPVGRSHQAPSLGFPSLLRDISTASPLLRRDSYFPPMFRPQRFSHSRRFTPPCTFGAYFIPKPRPRFSFQGFSPLPSRPGSSPTRSLLTFRNDPLVAELPQPLQITKIGLQSFHPGTGPLTPAEVLRLPPPRSPLKLSSPSGFPLNTVDPPSRLLRS